MTTQRRLLIRAAVVAGLAGAVLGSPPPAYAAATACTDLCWYDCNSGPSLCESAGGGCMASGCMYPGLSPDCGPYAKVWCFFVE